MQNYHLLNLIGQGQFGRVYKARRKFTGRAVSIKLLNKLEQNSRTLDLLKNEIDILRTIKHPNIMEFIEVFETKTDYCIVTEFGRSDLQQAVDETAPIPEKLLKNIALQLLNAINYLHKNEIVHRDIKPQNVLITNGGTLKICDFGFAIRKEGKKHEENPYKGTPFYMAPEIVHRIPYDEKIDIWSLGILLYQLYYGITPFAGETMFHLASKITNDEIEYPQPISYQLQTFLEAMLERDPKKRKSAEMLLKMDFLKDAEIDVEKTEMTQEKHVLNDEAIKNNLLPESKTNFIMPTIGKIDLTTIFTEVESATDEELLTAVLYLREGRWRCDSQQATSFASHFSQIIMRENLFDDSLKTATFLLEQDHHIHTESYDEGLEILFRPQMPLWALDFLTQVLLVPFSKCVASGSELYCMELDCEEAELIRDSILGFVPTEDPLVAAKALSLWTFLMRASDYFMTLISSAGYELIPLLVKLVESAATPAEAACVFTIVTLIIRHNPFAINLIEPMDSFVEALLAALSSLPDSISKVCNFSAAASFLQTSYNSLKQMPEFSILLTDAERKNKDYVAPECSREFLRGFFEARKCSKRTFEVLLSWCEQMPDRKYDFLSYVSMLESPFRQFPITPADFGMIAESITRILPIHQHALLMAIESIPPTEVLKNYADLAPLFFVRNSVIWMCEFTTKLIALSPQSSSSDQISLSSTSSLLSSSESLLSSSSSCFNLSLSSSNFNAGPKSEIMDVLIKKDIANALALRVRKFSTQTPDVIRNLLLEIIKAQKKSSRQLLDETPSILRTFLKHKVHHNIFVCIIDHLASIDSSFIPIIESVGGLKFVATYLKAKNHEIRSRVLSFVGFYAKWKQLPAPFLDEIAPSLIRNFRSPHIKSRRHASFALGNVIYKHPERVSLMEGQMDAIRDALGCSDIKTVACTTSLVSNMLRKSDKYLHQLIKAGIIKMMVSLLKPCNELSFRVIHRFTAIVRYKEGWHYLKKPSRKKCIERMTRVKNRKAAARAKAILELL